jgi:uncharacterized protein
MLPTHAPSLTQVELVRLDRFLHSESCGSAAMGLSRAHGFLTAAASGPEALEPGEWIRLVFDEPVFEDGEQAREMLGLAMRLYQDIELSLRADGQFRPVLEYVRDGSGATHMDAGPWCEGFISGMTLCREHWTHGARGVLDEPLSVIFRLAGARSGHDPGYVRLCDALPPAAEVMYRYWRSTSAGEA